MAKSDKANEKTNVMRLLDQADIAYTPRYYDASLASGTEVAAALGQSAECVFKTLVAEANTGEHFVFVIPAPETLSLKKAAKAAGVKSIAMLPQKKLLPLTGYVHGGCSPVGMKKPFPTWIDETALLTDAFFCSAGRLGAEDVSGIGTASDNGNYTPLNLIFTVTADVPGETDSLYVESIPLDASATVKALQGFGFDPYWPVSES